MRRETLKIKARYKKGQWKQAWVHDAMEKGRITADEYAAIVSPETIVGALPSNPTKAQLLEAADTLGVDVPDGATNAAISMLLDAEAGL